MADFEYMNYALPFPTLSQWLKDMLESLPESQSGRIRIRDGYPDYRVFYYSGHQPIRHVHGCFRYSHNLITFRSKHVTDRIMQAGVVRYTTRKHGDIDVDVFIKKRRIKNKGTAHVPKKERPALMPWCDDDELPF